MRKQLQGPVLARRLSHGAKKRIRKGLVLANVLSLVMVASYLSPIFQTYAADAADLTDKQSLAQESGEAGDRLEPEPQTAGDEAGEQPRDTATEGEPQPGAPEGPLPEEGEGSENDLPGEENREEEGANTPGADPSEGESPRDAEEGEKEGEEPPETSDDDRSGEHPEEENSPEPPEEDQTPEDQDPKDPEEDPAKEEETLPGEEDAALSPEDLAAGEALAAQAAALSTRAISPLGYDLDFLRAPNPSAPASGSDRLSVGGGIWPHISTFGILYDDKALMDPVETAWIGAHYDMVMSGTVSREASYDLLKAANPDIKLVGYTVVDPTACAYMEQWCIDRNIDPEKLYYHYTVDTTVNLRQYDSNGKLKTITVPGYPNGSAATVAESRVMETWGARNPSVCPTSPVLREAYIAFVTEQRFTVNEAQNKYLDGFIWDTYDSITDFTFDLQLENTHEMQHLGLTDGDSVRSQAADDLALLRSELEGALSEKAGKPVSVVPNAAEDEYIHRVHRPVYAEQFGGDYDEVMVEYLTNSLRSRVIDSKHYMDVYDDMENGILYLINSETNVFKKEDFGRPLTDQQWEDFRQFTVAAQYLVLHPNAYFSYHQGSAAIYQGMPKGTVRDSHWNVNYEFDPGSPVVRSGPDAWGATGTDRFYVLEEKGIEYRVLAREFDNCLVIAKFGHDSGSLYQMGGQEATYQLGGEYRRLMPDNTYGPVITEIALCKGGGAILVKRAVADGLDGGHTPVNPSNPGGSGSKDSGSKDSDSDSDSGTGIVSTVITPAAPPPLADKPAATELPPTGGDDAPPVYAQTPETAPPQEPAAITPREPLEPQQTEPRRSPGWEPLPKAAKRGQAAPLPVGTADSARPDDRLWAPAWILLAANVLILAYLLFSGVRHRRRPTGGQ